MRRLTLIRVLFSLGLWMANLLGTALAEQNASNAGAHERGLAAFYSRALEGHKTGCGGTYIPTEMTTAHRTPTRHPLMRFCIRSPPPHLFCYPVTLPPFPEYPLRAQHDGPRVPWVPGNLFP